jgi:glycosyltransferase involved in cell wall biosynthesis
MGGAEVLAAQLARQLSNEYRIVFVCLDDLGSLGEGLRAEGFTVIVLNRRQGWDWQLPRNLATFWRREKVDLVQAHQYTPFFYCLVSRLFYRRPAVLFTEHGRHYPDFRRPKRVFANRLLMERRDRVVAVGHAVRQALIDNEGFPPQRVGVIYNGIDLRGQHSTKRGAVRFELGLGANDLVILQVARLDYLKDHQTAIRAMELVTAPCPQAHLLLVGEGPQRATIEIAVRERRLESHVHLLGLRTDVARLLWAADLFLLTSISEGIPLTIIEAMAAGLPVVATRVGGVTEMVENGLTGFLAPTGDDRAVADAILRLVADAELRHEMGRRGQARGSELFSAGKMHTAYAQLYQEMCGD